jgi:hypothetical protein
MTTCIKDRVNNADVYEREYISKYPQYGYSRRKIGFNIDDLWEPKKKKYFPGRRRIMNSSTKCKHRQVREIENKLCAKSAKDKNMPDCNYYIHR